MPPEEVVENPPVEQVSDTPTAPGGTPTNPTDANPDALDASDQWVLSAFEPLAADDVEEWQEESPIPPQGGIPDPATPGSQQTGTITQPATATTPVPQAAVSTPPAPGAGAVAQPTVGTQPGQVPVPPATDPATIMAQIAQGIEQQRAEFVQRLAKEQYALSEKEKEDLGLTEEQAQIWALRQAAIHLNTTSAMTQLLSQHLPGMVAGISQQRNDNQKKEEAFFDEWPQLKTASRERLAQVFQTVNQLHPELKGEAWRKKAGEFACFHLGVPAQNPQAQPNGAATQQVRTPGPIVRQTNPAYSPVASSTSPAPTFREPTEEERFFQLLKMTDEGVFDR